MTADIHSVHRHEKDRTETARPIYLVKGSLMHDDSGEPIGDLYPRTLSRIDALDHTRHLATSLAPGPPLNRRIGGFGFWRTIRRNA
jgi:hypothetical protein